MPYLPLSSARTSTAPPAGSLERQRDPIVIVGGGLTGLAAATRLDQLGEHRYALIEREARPGGWATTDRSGEFAADRGGHVLYFRRDDVRRWVESLLDARWIRHTKRCVIDSRGVRTPFPYHANLYGRPPDVIEECLAGLVEVSADRLDRVLPATFRDWILDRFGPGVADHFMVPYNTKMWTVPPEMMGPDWMGGFIPPVDLDRAVRGARARLNSPIGLNAEFFYPEAGMSSLPGKLAMNLLGHTRYGVSVVKVAPRTHRIDLSDGSSYRYSSLISTMPLPTLVELIDDVPEAVRRRAASLESVDLVLVDVGTRRMNDGGVHWAYLPDSDVLGFRVSAVHNLSDRMVPKGQGLYTVEVAHSRRRPLPAGSIQDRVVADLVRSGWIAGGGEVTFLRERRLRHGYAIPLVGSRRSSAAIRRALDALDIHSVGRFGEWKYSNMEDALSDGRGVADELALGLPDRAAG